MTTLTQEIGSLAKGKGAEFSVFSELLRRGVNLYLPVMDVGIDAIVRKEDGTCLEIQVKSTQEEDQAGWFNVYDIDQHKGTQLFIVCVDLSKGPPEVWIIPAKVFIEYSNVYEPEKGWKRYTLGIDSKSKKHGNKLRRDILRKYLAAWDLLT